MTMTHQIPAYNTKLDKAMSQEQFNQIVEAILAGKYSWACVLILRFAGYNPLHYIPYRTYNRLLKDNCQAAKQSQNQNNQNLPATPAKACLSQIKDLAYLEVMSKQKARVTGGYSPQWLDWYSEDIATSEQRW